MDPIIRPANSVVLLKLQSAEGMPATPSASADAVPVEADSISYTSAWRREDANEATGSLVASAPMVVGQPARVRFRSRIKGAGAGTTYTSSIKPPLHQAYQACGLLGQFTAAIAAAALTAGTSSSATLGTGFDSTAQVYRGMPLILSVGPNAGQAPLVTNYPAAKVATLSDSFASPLSSSVQAALPANWTYAGTSPRQGSDRATMHPLATIALYEDGKLHQWMDCRGVATPSGETAKPGFEDFEFVGTYLGESDAAIPTGLVLASHSAPLLVTPANAPPALLINRRNLPISRWSVGIGGAIDNPADPGTPHGFGPGQIGPRVPILEIDPKATLVATRSIQAEIAAFSNYPAALRFGQTAGNRWSLLMPQVQPVEADPATAGAYRSETQRYQALSPGRDAYDRDGDMIRCFF